MLEIRDLRVSYGPIDAVRGIDLDVAAGQCVALLGPNGAGKSSTLRALSRLETYQGTATFAGRDLRRLTPEVAARAGLVLVPEGRHVFPNLTVQENLLVGGSTRRSRPDWFSVDDVYDLFPKLVALRDRGGWALSGGEQQMVAIGRGLLSAPELLMLDEPSLGLAPVVVREVFDVLGQLRGRVSILLVEQNTTMALRVSDNGYVMSRGEVVLSGSAQDLSADSRLLDSYLGRGAPDASQES